MNSLSWLLYGADALDNIRTIAGISAFGLSFAVLGAGVFAGILTMDDEDASRPLRATKTLALWLIVPTLILAVSPSRNTIMLIAASEIGETILASPQAQSIGGEAGELATDSLRVLRKFINEQLETADKP